MSRSGTTIRARRPRSFRSTTIAHSLGWTSRRKQLRPDRPRFVTMAMWSSAADGFVGPQRSQLPNEAMAAEVLLVLSTFPDVEIARRICRQLVEEHCAACANIIPQVESIYWWKEKVESGGETLA